MARDRVYVDDANTKPRDPVEQVSNNPELESRNPNRRRDSTAWARDRHRLELEPAPLDKITSSMKMSDDAVTYSFQFVNTGNCRLSLDGKKTWREFVVAATPVAQTLDVSVEK